MAHERLPKILALPIFASDALSSTAYASEEIMAALLVAGTGIFNMTPMLSLAIIVLLSIVVISYRQIVLAYPSGGGATSWRAITSGRSRRKSRALPF